MGTARNILTGEIIVTNDDAPEAPDMAALRASMTLTRRQVIIGMVASGFITEAEGIAMAATGAAPASVEALIAAMPPGEQSAARITLAAFTTAYRADALVEMFKSAGGLTDEQMDEFFATFAAV